MTPKMNGHSSGFPCACRGSGTAVNASQSVLYCAWSIVVLLAKFRHLQG